MPNLTGQTALIIGGSSGMGRGAAMAMAQRGGDVVISSHSAERVQAAVTVLSQELRPTDGAAAVGSVTGVVCDLNDTDSITRVVERLPALDHLVVTAAPGRGVTDREFFDGKFWGTHAAATAAGPRLPEHGTMTFTSGGLAVHPTAGQWSVTCAFAAIEALARAYAVEYAPRRVNCIRPGLFDTATWADLDPDARRQFFEQSSAQLPAGRPATGEDFGDALIGLIGLRYLTGQVIVLDGGAALLGAG